MTNLMTLAKEILDQLNADEIVLVQGGIEIESAVNNGSGVCYGGPNNGSGTCYDNPKTLE